MALAACPRGLPWPFQLAYVGCFGLAYVLFVTLASLKLNLIASRVELMNYLIYFEGDIILYYGNYKENK